MPGNASPASTSRVRGICRWRLEPATASPINVPMVIATIVDTTLTYNEFLAPSISSVVTSLPARSVPNRNPSVPGDASRFVMLSWFGGYGVQTNDSNATKTKVETRAPPM